MRTVLVVDDDAAVRGMIADYLVEAGFEVVAAPDTVTALRELLEHPETDVCLVDLVMPSNVPNGAVFARSAKSVRPDVPVILMTGYYAAAVRVPDYARQVLYKPIDLDELVSEIERRAPPH